MGSDGWNRDLNQAVTHLLCFLVDVVLRHDMSVEMLLNLKTQLKVWRTVLVFY